MRLLLWCAAALSMATGAFAADVTAEQASAFRPGVATYEDVVASFGSPSTDTASSDGSRTIIYVSVRSHVKAVTLVPIIGLFVGGAKSTTTTVSFTFRIGRALAAVEQQREDHRLFHERRSLGRWRLRQRRPGAASLIASAGVRFAASL